MKKYLDYLYETAFGGLDNYKELAGLLFSIPYEWTLDMDENRMYDGIEMRREFEELCKNDSNYDINTCLNGGACMMLEFFVGFAHRLVRDMFDHGIMTVPDLIKIWFINLDIWRFSDSNWGDKDDEIVQDHLDYWIDLDYDYDGFNGGLFEMSDPPDDLRETEMWVQASWWYNEKYCK